MIMQSSGANRSTHQHGLCPNHLPYMAGARRRHAVHVHRDARPTRRAGPPLVRSVVETYYCHRNLRWLLSKRTLVTIETYAGSYRKFRCASLTSRSLVAIPSSRRISRRYVPQVHARPPPQRAPRRVKVDPRLHALVPRVRYVLVISVSLHSN